MPAPERTARGAARRAALVTAAADLVDADGPAAVSHRAVAAGAGVPLAATTYYFRDLDDLVAAGVELGCRREQETAAAGLADLPHRRRSAAATAGLVVDTVLTAQRTTDAQLYAYYERWLASGRHPAARPALQAARERLDALLAALLDRCGHPGVPVGPLVALLDGTVLSALVEGGGQGRARATAAVADLLDQRKRRLREPSRG